MIILSNFAETLAELKNEKNFTSKQLADKLGFPPPTLSRYLKAQHMPTVKNLVTIADYFNCSTDFLLGREEYSEALTFKKCPPLCERMIELPQVFGITAYKFYNKAGIDESSYYEWKNGKSVPNLESIVKIADKFDRRIDFILGRES